jgi:hypothetical protein
MDKSAVQIGELLGYRSGSSGSGKDVTASGCGNFFPRKEGAKKGA